MLMSEKMVKKLSVKDIVPSNKGSESPPQLLFPIQQSILGD